MSGFAITGVRYCAPTQIEAMQFRCRLIHGCNPSSCTATSCSGTTGVVISNEYIVSCPIPSPIEDSSAIAVVVWSVLAIIWGLKRIQFLFTVNNE